MQSVERRKHRKGRPGRAGLVLLCALLLAGCVTAAILLRKNAEVEPPVQRQRVTGAVTRRSQEEFQSLTIIPREGEPWTAVREADGSLRIRKPDGTENEDWKVDELIGGMLLDAAVNLTYEDVFTENRNDWEPHAEDFGLKDPLVTAVIRFTDGSEVTARIGNSADPDNDAYYYLAVDGDDRLFALPSGTVQDLNVEKNLLHPVPALQIRSVLLDRITVREADGDVRTEWKLQGKITDRDAAENWLVTEPFTYPADYEQMKNLRDSAENLRLGTYIGPAEEETLAQYGLDRPSAVIELHMATGSTGTVSMGGVYDVTEWEERTAELILGSPRSEMVDYVRYGNGVYTISHFSVSAFTETDALNTTARYPVATPLGSLESVMVAEAGGETVHYALLRPEDSGQDTAAGEEEAAVRCLRNGKEIPYDTFAAAYERLLTVTVSGRLPEDWQPGEAHKKYTFRTVSGGTHTVELSNYDGMHDAVTMDGCTLFYLIRDGMTDLP